MWLTHRSGKVCDRPLPAAGEKHDPGSETAENPANVDLCDCTATLTEMMLSMQSLRHSPRHRTADHRPRHQAVVWSLIIVASAMLALPARAWDQVHEHANTGFVDIRTRPADLAVRKLVGVGLGVVPGSGPVIGADGTVYLATFEGRLSAFTRMVISNGRS